MQTQAALEAGGRISKAQALSLGSTKLEKLLLGSGKSGELTVYAPGQYDLVVIESGDLLSFEGKVVSVVSPRRGVVDLF